MKLEGAIVHFLGDSITEGCGASCTEKGFVAVLEKMYGLKKANNYGIGGSRIARQIVVTENIYDRDFCMRYAEMDQETDAVVVFGGTNDYGHGEAPLGAATDREPDTFFGACHYLMRGLLERWPDKPICFLTPLHRLCEDDPKGEGGLKRFSAAPLSVYRDILMECAAFYGLPVLDLWSVSGMQPRVEAVRERLMPDGLHPSDAGHEILARRIGQFLMTL